MTDYPVQGNFFVSIPSTPSGSGQVAEFFSNYGDNIDEFSAPLEKPAGQWLPGMKRPDGAYVCALAPMESGHGVFILRTHMCLILENQSNVDAHCRVDIGVSNSNGPSFPMFPYWGFLHGRGDYPYSWNTVRAGESVYVYGHRVDIVDGDRMLAQNGIPVPGWPDWTLQPGSGGGPPKLVIVAGCDTDGAKVIAKCTSMFLHGIKNSSW